MILCYVTPNLFSLLQSIAYDVLVISFHKCCLCCCG